MNDDAAAACCGDAAYMYANPAAAAAAADDDDDVNCGGGGTPSNQSQSQYSSSPLATLLSQNHIGMPGAEPFSSLLDQPSGLRAGASSSRSSVTLEQNDCRSATGADTDQLSMQNDGSERKQLFPSSSSQNNIAGDNDASSKKENFAHGVEEKQDVTMLSILNVVVDHVMVPPTPLEEEEFDIFCRQRQRKKDMDRRKEEEQKQQQAYSDTLKSVEGGDARVDPSAGTTLSTALDDAGDKNVADEQQPLPQQPSQLSQASSGRDNNDLSPFPSPPLPPPNERILVPVLRFFGPIIRGDPNNARSMPRQSGCLHVHGAYPYLLARPVAAGPDGSPYRPSSGQSTDAASSDILSSHRLDWDNPDSVSSIVDEIHAKLEGSLRATEEWKAKRDSLNGRNDTADVAANSSDAGNGSIADDLASGGKGPPIRYIRKVSVVIGRGFYTYCSGPPAPFLRVEYYDPKTKWKVKLMLERGLDVDDSYHPDSRFYDYAETEEGACSRNDLPREESERSSDDNMNGLGGRQTNPLLKFRCYDAHLPHTMQVFKDLNLSGMSYIKIRRGLFRRSLPRKERNRRAMNASYNGVESEGGDDAALFLDHNVLDSDKWDLLGVVNSQSNSSLQLQSHSDNEINSIEESRTPQSSFSRVGGLSQQDVSESKMSETLLQSARRHSPPSAMDLSSDEQYWTTKETLCDVELDATIEELLNIKDVMTSLPKDPVEKAKVHWRAVPSLREIWELERRRMASLLSKEEDFLNFSHEETTPQLSVSTKGGGSVPGAKLALKGAKKLYDPSPGLKDDYRRSLGDIVTRHGDFIDRVDEAFNGGPTIFTPNEWPSVRVAKTPTSSQDDALDALDALGGQFGGGPSSVAFHLSQSSTGQSPPLSSLTPKTPKSAGPSGSSICTSPLQSQMQALLTQTDMDDIHAATLFGDCVERGEDIIPEIESPDGPDASAAHRLRFSYGEDEEESDCDVYEEEERLGEDEFARSLSILATQHAASDELCSSESAIDGETHLQTQQVESHSLGTQMHGTIETIGQEDGLFSSDSDEDEADDALACAIYQRSQDRTSAESGFQQSEDSASAMDGSSILSPSLPEGTQLSLSTGDFVSPRANPPRRYELKAEQGKQHFYPSQRLNKDEGCPSWLRFAAAYQRVREVVPLLGCSDNGRNVYVQPTRRPPSSRQVSVWVASKQRKRGRVVGNRGGVVGSKHGSSDLSNRKRKANKEPGFEIDDNTGKLVASSNLSNKRKRVAFANDLVSTSCQVFAVEEVDWNEDDDDNDGLKSQMSQSPSQSQNSILSLSQDESSPASLKEIDSPVRDHKDLSMSSLTSSRRSQDSADELRSKGYSAIDASCTMAVDSQSSLTGNDALEGIGQQGGRIHIAGGGGLKGAVAGGKSEAGVTTSHLASAPTPVTIISVEVHVQCRTGKAGSHDSKIIAMRPDPTRDKVASCVYLYARDPGGGEPIEILERGALFTPVEAENVAQGHGDLIVRKTLGISLARAKMEMVRNERQLLLRLASIIKWKDPDALISWDTQGGGLGYLIERGVALGKEPSTTRGNGNNHGSSAVSGGKGKAIDMVKLLGRIIKKTPTTKQQSEESDGDGDWTGSGLGAEWDDRVGAGAAASSIEGRLVICGWKMIAEEVKHPNSSYLPAMVATILSKRIPHHDDLVLTRWYSASNGRYRRRVLEHRLVQATATIVLFDALDIIGRAGEAARLSGVEFSQSLPGIRGSQYKVEGCLLRALQSVWSDERGEKLGKNAVKSSATTSATQSAAGKNSASLSNDSSQAESPWKVQRGAGRAYATLGRAAADTCHATSQQTEGSNVDTTNRGYFFFSPSKEDCAAQEALECQAMTLEPQSGFHFDPIVVCDFTALYPSLIIAYNLCYSSVFGKLDYHTTRKEMRTEGSTTGRLGPFRYHERRTASVLKHHMKSLLPTCTNDAKEGKDRAYVIPTGTAFVSETVVKGVLPQVLGEILATRAMLKKAAKAYKKHVPDVSPSVLRSLEAKQLALKYVANVTYGYTSATFSGRSAMPLLADAIVECGRRTLTNAIELANQWGSNENGRWYGAHVVYGDTDSLFIKLPSRSVKEAFAFGESFCKAVTASNPPPVQLKLEKVYVASLLQTKKKYCGMKFESPTEKRPVFEAKGIETVRRDQCALTQKILRNALISVFSNGLDSTKAYLQRQWALIHAGRLPVSDFILTGRVRSHYRGGGVGPVQAALARRLAEADPGRTVRHKERIPYVIVAAPGRTNKLRDCVLTPSECLEQWDAFTINVGYYINKHVNAALQRCFGLPPFKIDISAWYQASPKPRKRVHHWPVARTGASVMITAHFGSDQCALCGDKCKAKGSARAVVCSKCSRDKVLASFVGMERINKAEQEADAVASICRECNGCPESSSTFAMERLTLPTKQRQGSRGVGGGLDSIVRRNSSNITAGVITPLANCVCIDCPVTYERHRIREAQIEAEEVCKALDIL